MSAALAGSSTRASAISAFRTCDSADSTDWRAEAMSAASGSARRSSRRSCACSSCTSAVWTRRCASASSSVASASPARTDWPGCTATPATTPDDSKLSVVLRSADAEPVSCTVVLSWPVAASTRCGSATTPDSSGWNSTNATAAAALTATSNPGSSQRRRLPGLLISSSTSTSLMVTSRLPGRIRWTG